MRRGCSQPPYHQAQIGAGDFSGSDRFWLVFCFYRFLPRVRFISVVFCFSFPSGGAGVLFFPTASVSHFRFLFLTFLFYCGVCVCVWSCLSFTGSGVSGFSSNSGCVMFSLLFGFYFFSVPDLVLFAGSGRVLVVCV
jgi:hypothetical protein